MSNEQIALDEVAVLRILNEVGAKWLPNDLDRSALLNDLQWAQTWFATLKDTDSGKLWRNRSRRLSIVSERASELSDMLSDEIGAWVSLRLGGYFPLAEGAGGWNEEGGGSASSFSALKQGLKLLAATAAKEAEKLESYDGDAPLRGESSPVDWLIGRHLPAVYKQHFDREGFSRPGWMSKQGSEPTGPMIRFIVASLREMNVTKSNGQAYSKHTIGSAYTKIKAGKIRRTQSNDRGN